MSQAASLYSKASALSESGTYLSELSYLFISAVTRHSMLLLRILTSKGWNATALSSLVLRSDIGDVRLPRVSKLEVEPNAILEGANANPTPADVSISLSLAHGPWLVHLPPRERIEVLRFMSKMYFQLSYRRKEAYILRELVSCIMDLVVHGREEIRNAVSLSTSASRGGTGHADEEGQDVGVRPTDEVAGNDSVIRLVIYFCRIYGVKLNSFSFLDEETGPGLMSDEVVKSDQVNLPHFGWPELQIELVKGALAIAEGLPGETIIIMEL